MAGSHVRYCSGFRPRDQDQFSRVLRRARSQPRGKCFQHPYFGCLRLVWICARVAAGGDCATRRGKRSGTGSGIGACSSPSPMDCSCGGWRIVGCGLMGGFLNSHRRRCVTEANTRIRHPDGIDSSALRHQTGSPWQGRDAGRVRDQIVITTDSQSPDVNLSNPWRPCLTCRRRLNGSANALGCKRLSGCTSLRKPSGPRSLRRRDGGEGSAVFGHRSETTKHGAGPAAQEPRRTRRLNARSKKRSH